MSTLASVPLVDDLLAKGMEQWSVGTSGWVHATDGVVETRRLELLTLSLQRRCSTS